jgi:hypothetical protein
MNEWMNEWIGTGSGIVSAHLFGCLAINTSMFAQCAHEHILLFPVGMVTFSIWTVDVGNTDHLHWLLFLHSSLQCLQCSLSSETK